MTAMHPRIVRPILGISIAGFAVGGCSDMAPDRMVSPTFVSADVSAFREMVKILAEYKLYIVTYDKVIPP